MLRSVRPPDIHTVFRWHRPPRAREGGMDNLIRGINVRDRIALPGRPACVGDYKLVSARGNLVRAPRDQA
ncbi:hypothetical protein A8E30_05640 [Burkholderia cenocepacia]|nr:hypothetical protein A8E30_05640 [Burkholderia cenocepacia]